MNRVDEIASAASSLMGQTAAARTVIVGRGIPYTPDGHASLFGLLITLVLSETDDDLITGRGRGNGQ